MTHRPTPARDWLDQLLAADHIQHDKCIIWPFALVGSKGYPGIKVKGVMTRVTRIVLTRFDRPPRPGEVAAHTPAVCHNKVCVNPHHLRWASHGDNMRDRFVDQTDPRGTRNPNNKLSADQVLAIYQATGANTTIGRQFGVAPSTVSNIRHNRSWVWLTSSIGGTER